jgi:hypothetical protein
MIDDTILPFWFPAVQAKKVTAAFDDGRLTSNRGVMVLAMAERRLGLADNLALGPAAAAARPSESRPAARPLEAPLDVPSAPAGGSVWLMFGDGATCRGRRCGREGRWGP